MSRNVDIIVEQISANDVSAIVVEVYLVDGSAVREGDRILAVETSKAVYEVFAPANGIFVHSLKVGDTVAFGSRIAQISLDRHDTRVLHEITVEAPAKSAKSPLGFGAEGEATYGKCDSKQVTGTRTPQFSREASVLASRYGIGPEEFDIDFVTSEEVKRRVEQLKISSIGEPASVSRVPSVTERGHRVEIPLLKQEEIAILRRGAGSSMLSIVGTTLGSKTLSRVGAGFFESKIIDLVVYEASRLMNHFKKFNAAYREDSVEYYDHVTAGVAIDGGTGLVVYGVAGSDKLSLQAIQDEIVSGFKKYVQNRLMHKQLARATFTVTDLSATGIDFMLPLLPAGQSCIIGITCSLERGYALFIGFDHRLTEGLEASRFLQRLRQGVVAHLTSSGPKSLECAYCHVDITLLTHPSPGKGLVRLISPAGQEILCCARCLNEAHSQPVT
jgi:pyruvate dehydrogenase E2 component (dihydrolipoamide acetyltransferase)